MNADEIWHSLYDKGINKGTAGFNDKQIDLYYFIDFIYQVEMNGNVGFVYNQSPTSRDENFYTPYIRTWKRFKMDELADKADLYNNQYLKAIELYNSSSKTGFQKYEDQFGLREIAESMYSLIDKIYLDQDDVWDWIQQNAKELECNIELPTWWKDVHK